MSPPSGYTERQGSMFRAKRCSILNLETAGPLINTAWYLGDTELRPADRLSRMRSFMDFPSPSREMAG
jgi:hypothetical protein